MKKLFLAFALIASCFALTTPVAAASGERIMFVSITIRIMK
jgi:hypothetical protein